MGFWLEFTHFFLISVLSCFKYVGSQLIYWQPYSILYFGDFNSFCGLYTEVSASFWKSSLMNNAVHTASFYSLVSMYQLDTTETFMLPDIMKVIALPKSLIPDICFLHSVLKNYPFFALLLIVIQSPSSKSMNECLPFIGLLKVLYRIYTKKCFLINELLSFLTFYEHLLGLCQWSKQINSVFTCSLHLTAVLGATEQCILC